MEKLRLIAGGGGALREKRYSEKAVEGGIELQKTPPVGHAPPPPPPSPSPWGYCRQNNMELILEVMATCRRQRKSPKQFTRVSCWTAGGSLRCLWPLVRQSPQPGFLVSFYDANMSSFLIKLCSHLHPATRPLCHMNPFPLAEV
jgi:hypothetical protein